MDSNLPRLQLELYKEIKKVGLNFLLLKKLYYFTVLSSICEILYLMSKHVKRKSFLVK